MLLGLTPVQSRHFSLGTNYFPIFRRSLFFAVLLERRLYSNRRGSNDPVGGERPRGPADSVCFLAPPCGWTPFCCCFSCSRRLWDLPVLCIIHASGQTSGPFDLGFHFLLRARQFAASCCTPALGLAYLFCAFRFLLCLRRFLLSTPCTQWSIGLLAAYTRIPYCHYPGEFGL